MTACNIYSIDCVGLDVGWVYSDQGHIELKMMVHIPERAGTSFDGRVKWFYSSRDPKKAFIQVQELESYFKNKLPSTVLKGRTPSIVSHGDDEEHLAFGNQPLYKPFYKLLLMHLIVHVYSNERRSDVVSSMWYVHDHRQEDTRCQGIDGGQHRMV
jgi:hypothetical protein